jgi:hypothetical protein
VSRRTQDDMASLLRGVRPELTEGLRIDNVEFPDGHYFEEIRQGKGSKDDKR